jgi:hypothetical protein
MKKKLKLFFGLIKTRRNSMSYVNKTFPAKKKWMLFLTFILSLLSLLFIFNCSVSKELDNVSVDILSRLRQLPGIVVTELQRTDSQIRVFQIDMNQPLDHNNPGGPSFTERMYLHHVDESRPMVIYTSGYMAGAEDYEELAEIMECNSLAVSQRFFADSKPDPLNWRYLTSAQASADYHEIVTLFKRVYNRQWISTGASKSGISALFHRFFYPNDVDATVVYCVPLRLGLADQRFPAYLASLGTAEDRGRIHSFQRRLLENRGLMIDLFQSWFPENGLKLIEVVDPGRLFEYFINDYECEFWVGNRFDSTAIPGEDASAQEMLAHLNAVTYFIKIDESEFMDYTRIPIYQEYTELGQKGYDISHLEDLLLFGNPDFTDLSTDIFGIEVTYDPTLMQNLLSWINTNGNNIIFIYGSNDPVTATAVDLGGQTNAIRIIVPNAHHYDARIRYLSAADREKVISALEEWLGIEIE